MRRLRPVAEQRDGLGRPDVDVLPGQQVAEVGAGLRDAEQAGFVVDQVVELVDRHPLGPHQEPDQPGVEVAGARAHDQPGGRGEAHRRVDAAAVADRRQARPRTEVGEDDAAPGRVRAGDPGQLLHQVGVGEAVEAVAADPGRLVPPRDRDDLRDARQVVMEAPCRSTPPGAARDRAAGTPRSRDLAGQVVGVEGDDPPQLVEDLGRDRAPGGRSGCRRGRRDARRRRCSSGRRRVRVRSMSRATAAAWSGASTAHRPPGGHRRRPRPTANLASRSARPGRTGAARAGRPVRTGRT